MIFLEKVLWKNQRFVTKESYKIMMQIGIKISTMPLLSAKLLSKVAGFQKKWSRLFEGRKGRSCNNPHKDNSITDFYDDWSIERTCDSATLESNHPRTGGTFLYTHECQDDEIAYFKIDFNFIGDSPDNLIGLF